MTNTREAQRKLEKAWTITIPDKDDPFWKDALKISRRLWGQTVKEEKDSMKRYVSEYETQEGGELFPYHFKAKDIDEADKKTEEFARKFKERHPLKQIEPLHIQTIEEYKHSQKVRKGIAREKNESWALCYGCVF
jgi:hypothetical protein